ncbi:TetR family transcriptional regulator ActII [Actinoallomurus acanthiterrae]
MASPPHRRRAARHQQPLADDTGATRRGPSAGRKKPITVDAIIETAFGIIEREGYDALTMRRVAGALETGPASLYAHVVNKEDLDDLLIGRLCAEIELPEPDPRTWREQIISVCAQLRDQYLRYPGISLAALSVVPTNQETLRVSEGMLGIVLAGGIAPQTAAWAIDALLLYVNAFCRETSLIGRHADQEGRAVSRDEMLRRFAALPDTFPNTKRHAAELTSGTALDRFEFTINVILDGLGHRK